jgi:hypothetical protein
MHGKCFGKNTVDWQGPRYRISFVELQRIQPRKLQCKLVQNVVDIRCLKKEPEGWESTLQEYGKIFPTDGMLSILTGSMQYKQCGITTIWTCVANDIKIHP